MNIDQLATMYSRCEITTVALQDKTSKQENVFYNIYSVVEFCPENQEKSERIENEEYSCVRYAVNNKYNVIIQRDFLDEVQGGLVFYRGKGNIHQLPKDVLQDFEPLMEEPPNEHCILFDANEEKVLRKVLPHFDCSVWLAMKMSPSERFLSLLTEEERWEVGKFIEQNLGIPLALYTEFWGAIFLCAKTIDLQSIEYQLGKDRSSLLVSLLPSEDIDFFHGEIELYDERRYGTGFYVREKIRQRRFFIQFPYEPERLHVRVYDENHQLIIDSSGNFLQKINFCMGIQSAYRVFQHGESKTEIPLKEYEKFSVGNHIDGAADRAMKAEQKRYLSSLEKNRVFLYFAGKEEEKERAAQIVKELIAKATERCIICDPYFSSRDFLTYGIQVTSLDIILKIITSAAFLRSKVDEGTELCQGETLNEVLTTVFNQGMEVRCYVLKGRKSPLHDRFIVVDDEVYLLGSSLSEFGSRATTLYRVPDPNLLIRQAEHWMKDEENCPLIEDWMKAREESSIEQNNSSWNYREIGCTS